MDADREALHAEEEAHWSQEHQRHMAERRAEIDRRQQEADAEIERRIQEDEGFTEADAQAQRDRHARHRALEERQLDIDEAAHNEHQGAQSGEEHDAIEARRDERQQQLDADREALHAEEAGEHYDEAGEYHGAADEAHDGWYCEICDIHFSTSEEMDAHAEEEGHLEEAGEHQDECDPDVEYPNNPPGSEGGCGDYDDCNGNGAFDIGEPCFEHHGEADEGHDG